ncbi:glycosyltransferase [Chlorobium phaeovibrioides]|uniref:Glycosyltransferase n=1 Tax=Chlorobium phaeovibrioides TaxID=1094 RepID=A0A5M8IB19_CHLPH|nr:glycosyltransferase [Chlorobium phaeovibrioides]KAA6232247.1 glycosyltransferase [Chlorobium phaeovibrioides]
MRIVLDMQGAQTESRFRGIGRYTISFSQAVVRNRGEHEIILALSGLFPDTIEHIRAAFDSLLPQENIRVWHAPGPVNEEQPGNDARRDTAELLREAFLSSLQPDVIHVSSLFEGFIDNAVTSIGRFDTATPVSVILHDLIPLLNPDHYLKHNKPYEQYYLRKVEHLCRAATYLANSDFTRKEGIDALSIESEKVVNISTAIDGCFQPQSIDALTGKQLKQKFGISRAFVLYTGGADERKNLPRLIQAYAALPSHIRISHQLIFAGKTLEGERVRLTDIARSAGMKPDELIFAGYVTDDELVQLYNLCALYVFPSWHEGFGLPALEAMACGAPVIGANTSSLPEVIGLDEALFDPFDVAAITTKMVQALSDEGFRTRLREHGQQQATHFSWDVTARRAIEVWDGLQQAQASSLVVKSQSPHKPRLAFVSPLPPAQTGIADYSAELLPALAEYYDIDVVVAQDRVDVSWVNQQVRIQGITWLRENAHKVDRVLYQIGNSPFHAYMQPLLREIPGTVVLHDFYISGLISWLEVHGGVAHAWTNALYESHGYGAVQERYRDGESAVIEFPVNFDVLMHAKGVIVHSEYSCKLARHWYGDRIGLDWKVIPLLRVGSEMFNRISVREQLGYNPDDFIICSFGHLDPTKLNHRLLNSWIGSALAGNKKCKLVFVGANHGGEYGLDLLKTIQENGLAHRVQITGFVSSEIYRTYLMASDLAVQLRTHSRGETSAAVLDCMNYALPVIVNANGSMAELDPDSVMMIPDEFQDTMLIDAMESLWREPQKRHALGERAREIIRTRHAPNRCAQRYADAIEHFYERTAACTVPALIEKLAGQDGVALNNAELAHLSQIIATNLPLPSSARRLFLDVTATCSHDLKTGIERVTRAMLLALLDKPPIGYRVEPVYLSKTGGKWGYRFARRYTLGLLDCIEGALDDELVNPENGDILLMLDLSGDMLVQAATTGLFAGYRYQGVAVYSVVYDLLPVLMPEVFPAGADRGHAQWLQTVSTFDGAICISDTVAADFAAWQAAVGLNSGGRRLFHLNWFHLGADVGNSVPSHGMPDHADEVMRQLQTRYSFLLVGTIEPRKGYLQTIKAFEQLWRNSIDVNLVIVGREGWTTLEPEHMRRNIPETVDRLKHHPELNKRLFWLEGISDEYLEKVYAASTCLIAASYGEGFGLPLIEAAQHKLPIIARDIPVFREVAGEYAYYFNSTQPEGLAESIQTWISLYENSQHPKSDAMPWLTWKESAAQLQKAIIGVGG